ncbi:MAG: hypothetical protein NTU61_01975, partial [Candidatus Altiarchaeota archaeon]|nr:hypothetical protein [Candidatus Altiarchaeota archaeon]
KNTPVDKQGCSALQYCNNIRINSLRDALKCLTADWKNNEPRKIIPNDCTIQTSRNKITCTTTKKPD